MLRVVYNSIKKMQAGQQVQEKAAQAADAVKDATGMNK